MKRAAVTLLILLLPATSSAQELKLEPIPPGESRIEVLREGEPAPYTGQLFDDPTALRWANWLRQARLVYRIDMRAEEEKKKAQKEMYERKLQLEREQYNRVVAEYSQKLKEAESDARNPPWYRTVWFGAVTGAAATAVVGVASVWAVGQLK